MEQGSLQKSQPMPMERAVDHGSYNRLHDRVRRCSTDFETPPPTQPLLILIPTNTHLERLDLQRQHAAVVPTQREVAAEEPEARVARLAPHGAQLALRVEPPDVLDAVRERVAKDGARLRAHVLVARREDDLVRRQLGAVGEPDRVRQHLGDLLALLDFDLAVDDELRGPDVDVVAPAALEVLHEQARAVGPLVELEARFREALEQRGVVRVLGRRDGDVDALEDGLGMLWKKRSASSTGGPVSS